MKTFIWSRGEFFIWLTGAALAFALIMVAALLSVVLYNGFGFFWPRAVGQYHLDNSTIIQGQAFETEIIPNLDDPGAPKQKRTKIKKGNRDLYGMDFLWLDKKHVKSVNYPPDLVVFERLEWGDFFGTIKEIRENGAVVAAGSKQGWRALMERLPKAKATYEKIQEIQKKDIGIISYRMENIRLHLKKLELDGVVSGEKVDSLHQEIEELKNKYNEQDVRLADFRKTLVDSVVMTSAEGRDKEIPLYQIVRGYRPNIFGLGEKVAFFQAKLWEFIFEDPREANTEGGVFPAIFGTVLMVMIMSLFATPLGVLAAFYLREYAKSGLFVSTVRIAVNNLAGVPSIVFGVFGVGFFIYIIGGSIDQIFFSEALPTPTYGTGGILWASLTLALLTVPVVIVATEEGLASVPLGIREASLALGATKAETLWRAVFPAVMPSILTGLILAMARAAGEVAPLMITGVVKMAPSLPVDGFWPFIHLERKFMHLGFHIYDIGFQSPNVDATRPMVFTTTLLLIGIVLLLNWTAIVLRNRLRKKLQVVGL